MRSFIVALLLLFACTEIHSAQLADPSISTDVARGAPRRVILKLKETTDLARSSLTTKRSARAAVKNRVWNRLSTSRARWTLRRGYSELPLAALLVSDLDALKRLLDDPEIDAVYPDERLSMHLVESMRLIDQPEAANVIGARGAGSTIAVLDTGADYTRTELGGCTSPGVPATCRIAAIYEAAVDDASLDQNGHGTRVSIAAATTAPQARIAAVDVFDGSGAFSSDVIEGINWSIANRSSYNIVAINMSLGISTGSNVYCNGNAFAPAIQDARDAGIVVVASSGNNALSNGISSPACVENAVAVGSVYDANVGGIGYSACSDNSSAADQIACFSNSGNPLDILAPGSLIGFSGSGYAGTSYSAPIVAGAVAVLRSRFPSDTPAQAEARLLNSGVPVSDPRNGLVRPRLDLLAAQGPPSNDNFGAALNLGGTSGTASAWNFNASVQSGEPLHGGVAGGRSVWWTWTAPSNGNFTLSTSGSSFDSVLALYQGIAVNALNLIGQNDNGNSGTTSDLSTAVAAGQTYRIAVDGKNAQEGAISLAYSFSPQSGQANLSITLGGLPSSLSVGDQATLIAQVANSGPQSAAAVSLNFSLPSQLDAVAAPGNCVINTGTVNCNLGNLNNGAAQQIAIALTATGLGTAISTATASSVTPDPVASNNSATATTSVQAAAPGGGQDGDVPLPAWAIAVLGSLLCALIARSHTRRQ